jgi:hypothetical protein
VQPASGAGRCYSFREIKVLRNGLVAPSGTLCTILERRDKEVRAVLATEDVKKRFAVDGVEPLPPTPIKPIGLKAE